MFIFIAFDHFPACRGDQFITWKEENYSTIISFFFKSSAFILKKSVIKSGFWISIDGANRKTPLIYAYT